MRRRVGKGSLPPHRVALRVVIDEAPPALAMERLPMAFRLGEPVRDGEERRRMRHEAYVARLDDDVLGEVAPRLEAAAPGYNAVGRTPDRRRRHGRRCAQASVKIVRIDAMPAGELVQAPRIRLARMAGERRTKRDDEPHQFGRKLCELARIEPAKTPADETDLAPARDEDVAKRVVGPIDNTLAQSEVQSLTPSEGREPAHSQEAPHERGGGVARCETRQDEHRVAIAPGCHAPHGSQRYGCAMFPDRTDFEKLQQNPRSPLRAPRRMRACVHCVSIGCW